MGTRNLEIFFMSGCSRTKCQMLVIECVHGVVGVYRLRGMRNHSNKKNTNELALFNYCDLLLAQHFSALQYVLFWSAQATS